MVTVTTINMRRIMAGTTLRLRVVGARRMRVRLAIGMALIRLAARAIGCNVEVGVETQGA